jgi:hypothetical protein
VVASRGTFPWRRQCLAFLSIASLHFVHLQALTVASPRPPSTAHPVERQPHLRPASPRTVFPRLSARPPVAQLCGCEAYQPTTLSPALKRSAFIAPASRTAPPSSPLTTMAAITTNGVLTPPVFPPASTSPSLAKRKRSDTPPSIASHGAPASAPGAVDSRASRSRQALLDDILSVLKRYELFRIPVLGSLG